LARVDVVSPAAIFEARGNVQRTGKTDVESSIEIGVCGPERIAERAGVERGLTRGALRNVERVANVEIELVAAVTGTRVIEPRPRLAANAGVERGVDDARLDQWQIAERIDLRPVGGIERATVIAAVRAVADAVRAERIEDVFGVGADRDVEIEERHQISLVRVAPMRVRLRHRVVALVAGDDLIARIGQRAVGLVTFTILPDREERARADFPPAAETRVDHLAVGVRRGAAFDFEAKRR